MVRFACCGYGIPTQEATKTTSRDTLGQIWRKSIRAGQGIVTSDKSSEFDALSDPNFLPETVLSPRVIQTAPTRYVGSPQPHQCAFVAYGTR